MPQPMRVTRKVFYLQHIADEDMFSVAIHKIGVSTGIQEAACISTSGAFPDEYIIDNIFTMAVGISTLLPPNI